MLCNYKKYGLIIIIGILITVFFLIRSFLFLPISYNNLPGSDRLKWYNFKRPIRLELEYWNTEDPENYWVNNEDKIKFVYSELTKSEIVNYDDYNENRGLFIWLVIRRLDNDNIIQHVHVLNNGIAEIDEGIYVKLTDELWSYLESLQERDSVRIIVDDDHQ